MKTLFSLLLLMLPVAHADMDITRELIAPDKLVPGQPATVAVTFWTDSWFNPPPSWPAMIINNGVLLSTTPPNQLVSRQSHGISWSGVRLERKVTAWDQGRLRLPAMKITLQSTGQPPKTVQLAALEKTVSWPADVRQPDRFLPAASLTLQQQWQTYSAARDKELHIGDVIERVVTLSATDVTSSQIPQLLYAIPGSDTQRLAPQNSVITRGRGEQVGVQRVERLRYLPSQPGVLSIPPLQLRWWDTVHQQWQQADLPGATYSFSPARNAGSEKVLQVTARTAWGTYLLSLAGLGLLCGALWLCRQWLWRSVRYVWRRLRYLCQVVPLPGLLPNNRQR